MKDGSIKLIQDVIVDDILLGYYIDGMIKEIYPNWKDWTTNDLSSGTFDETIVLNINGFVNKSYYKINNDLRVTERHTFFVNINTEGTWGWKCTSELNVGDSFMALDQSTILIENIEIINENIDVYLINVNKFDVFFAGMNNQFFLIHNGKA
jgi:hypothetical protein